MAMKVSLFSAEERAFAEAIREASASNPFLPERIAAERRALGAAFEDRVASWNTQPPLADTEHPNILALLSRCEGLLRRVHGAWPEKARLSAGDGRLYETVAGFWLFHAFAPRFDAAIESALEPQRGRLRIDFYPAFRDEAERLFERPGLTLLERQPTTHLFACAFQIRRAFHHIFRFLVGGSTPMARLRAEIWQSIFTHDLDRYREVLYNRLGDFATLITGPSGSGKELVARALGLSRYIPFDPRSGGFARNFAEGFFPLNLAALSPTLIESELFGHRKGAFTGALADRRGWMETCPSTGAVFLDEIGETELGIQVKLLRVLQSRLFQPLGGTESRRFEGKIIAATNRDLTEAIRAGRFREDFYYRLCSDRLATPSLREQLDAAPEDLTAMLAQVAQRFFPSRHEAESFADEAARWIERHLGASYAWPGNFRELEQCVRGLLLRGTYRPIGTPCGAHKADWLDLARHGRLTAEALLTHYTKHVHAEARSVEETSRRLDLDRRTVKARLGRDSTIALA